MNKEINKQQFHVSILFYIFFSKKMYLCESLWFWGGMCTCHKVHVEVTGLSEWVLSPQSSSRVEPRLSCLHSKRFCPPRHLPALVYMFYTEGCSLKYFLKERVWAWNLKALNSIISQKLKLVTEEVQGSWVCHEAINGSHLLSWPPNTFLKGNSKLKCSRTAPATLQSFAKFRSKSLVSYR